MYELILEVEELEERAVPAFIWYDEDTENPVPPTPPTNGG